MNDIPIFRDTYKDKEGKPLIPNEPYAECPFCGQNDTGSLRMMETNPSEIMGREQWYVMCTSCEAKGPKGSTLKSAFEGWQREPYAIKPDDWKNDNRLKFLICSAIDRTQEKWDRNELSGGRPVHILKASYNALHSWYLTYVKCVSENTEEIKRQKEEWEKIHSESGLQDKM